MFLVNIYGLVTVYDREMHKAEILTIRTLKSDRNHKIYMWGRLELRVLDGKLALVV